MEKEVFNMKMYQRFRNILLSFKDFIPSEFTLMFFEKFKKYTQSQKIYWHLTVYGYITARECTSIYGIQHPPDVIRRLRKQGINIVNVEDKGFNRFGEYCHFVKYTLVKDDAIEECA